MGIEVDRVKLHNCQDLDLTLKDGNTFCTGRMRDVRTSLYQPGKGLQCKLTDRSGTPKSTVPEM